MSSETDRLAALVPAAIVAYFALQSVARLAIPGGLGLDEAEKMVTAQALAWGYGAQPPLYTWLQIGVFALTGEGLAGLSLLKNALLVLTFLGLWSLARQLGADRVTAAAAALGLFLVPAIAWESQRALTHSVLATAVAVWTMAAAIWAVERGGSARWALVGLALGVGLIAKGTYAPLAAGLLIAGAALPWARSRGWWIALGVALPVVAGPTLWTVLNWDLASQSVHKFGIEGETSRIGAALVALWQVARVLLSSLAPVVAVFAVTLGLSGWAWTSRTTPGQRLLEASLLLGMLTVVIAGLAVGATGLKGRWLQPLLVFVPLVLAMRIVPLAERRGVRVLGIAGIAAAVAMAVALPWNLGLGTRNPPHQAAPIACLAAQAPLGDGLVLAENTFLGGNLRLADPRLAVTIPAMAGLNRDATPSVLVWLGQGDASEPPAALVALLQRRIGAAALPGTVRFAEAPYPWPFADRRLRLYWAPVHTVSPEPGAAAPEPSPTQQQE